MVTQYGWQCNSVDYKLYDQASHVLYTHNIHPVVTASKYVSFKHTHWFMEGFASLYVTDKKSND